MKSLQENMIEFRKQLAKGAIQNAYQGLMQYMLNLKNHFSDQYPDFAVPGSLYHGYMDMTYFSVIPGSLKGRELKIAIVFVYDAFRFEAWLSGRNQKVMAKKAAKPGDAKRQRDKYPVIHGSGRTWARAQLTIVRSTFSIIACFLLQLMVNAPGPAG